MSEEKTQATKDDTNNPVIPTTATSEYVDEPVDDKPQTPTETNNSSQVKDEPVQVIVNATKEKNGVANTIAIIGLLVNIILAVFTYMLFREANNATHVATDALKTTQESVKESKRANDIAQANLILAQQSAKENNIVSNENLGLSKQSLGAQINSINESQKQFYASNNPYLQFEVSYLDDPVIGQGMNMQGVLKNVTQIPAKVISQRYSLYYSGEVYPYEKNLRLIDNIGNIYAVNGIPSTMYYTIEKNVDAKSVAFLNGDAFIIMHSEIRYINLITNKERAYKFILKMKKKPGFQLPNDLFTQFTYNENYDVKK